MKRKPSLHARMTLWFSLSMVVITALFGGTMYLITQTRLSTMLRDSLALAMEQLSSQVELKHGRLMFEDETPVAPDILYAIMEANGSELASRGDALFDDQPFREGEYTLLRTDDVEWLLLDSPLLMIEQEGVRIRTAASCQTMESTLGAFRAVFAVGVPVMTLLAVLLGSFLTRRSLQPIHQVIACAQNIAAGDLSGRIPENASQDELGELTRTLNHMLASLEDSFRRERRFTSDASHELRTPVAVIMAYAESLKADPSLNGREKVETILMECGRMQRMIGQMLTLTRGQEGRYPVTMETIRLDNVMEGVKAAMEEPARERGITLRFEMNDAVELTADQSLMTQLLLNLTENAVKYGREGGEVVCRVHREGGQAVLIVSDNGIGIAPEHLPHIFERFFRADSARDREGTGLGLSIVRWIIDLHGGDVSVQSEIGKGTSFTITLPIRPPQVEKRSKA